MSNSDRQTAAFGVALFHSVQGAIGAEKLLIAAGLTHKLVAVPRHLSSNCGFCLRFAWTERDRIDALLANANLGLERIVRLSLSDDCTV